MLKTKIYLLSFFCLFYTASFSQSKNIRKKCKSLLREAQFYLDNEDYSRSWQFYREVLALDKMNELAGVNGALCLAKLNYPVDSLLILTENLSSSTMDDAKFFLAKIKHRQRSFDAAITLLEQYEKMPERKRLYTNGEVRYVIGMCIHGKSFTSSPRRSGIKSMGANINSPYADYVPVIMPDESALYFTSKREGSSNNKRNGDNNFYEDVYVSYCEDGVWKKAENVGEPVNTETNDGCVAISPDGQRMIVFRTAADPENGDLYITQMGLNNKWEPLQLMNKEINSPYIEASACFSNDSSEIYFSSNRPGGLGGKDLYRIKKLPNGDWSPAMNLGPSVNSAYDEDAPFLHPDGITLYYSSKGHNTMGEYDVFKSVWNSGTNQFSQAENLGYPLNDVGNDIFFVLSVDGQRGYYSSQKEETFGGMDIYQVDTRFKENDLKVEEGLAYIEGIPGKVKITLVDKETSIVTGNFYSHPGTGKFILILNPLKPYKVLIEEEDCDPLTMEIQPLAPDMAGHHLQFKLKKRNAQ